MRRRWLRLLATFLFRRAGWVIPLVLLVTALAVWQGQKLEFDTSLASFLPPASAEARVIRELLGDYRKLEPVLVVLRSERPGHEADLRLLGRDLARWLDDPKYFSTPVLSPPGEPVNWSERSWLQFLPPEDWDNLRPLLERQLRETIAWRINALTPAEWLAQSNQPPGLAKLVEERIAGSRGPTRITGRDGYYMSPDGRALLLLLYPARSPEDGNAALTTLRFTRRCVDFLFERHEDLRGKIDIQFYGSIISTGQHIDKMSEELGIIVRFAIPLAFLLYLLVFRKIEALLFIALPPAMAFAWTLGLTRILFGEITGVAMMFMIVILAIGIEYTLQLYHRFTLDLYRTHHYYRALARAYTETGRGILASALLMGALFVLLFLTTLGGGASGQGFFAVLTGAGGFARLALVLALGLSCNLLACLLALPLMAAVKQWLARDVVKPVPLYRFNLERFYLPAILNPRATLAIMLLIGVVLGLGARTLDFAPNFAAISPFFYRPSDPSLPNGTAPAATPAPTNESTSPADADFSRPGRPIIAVVSDETIEGALERNDRLEANLRAVMQDFGIYAYDSLRWTLPSRATQQAAIERLRGLDLTKLRGDLNKVVADLGLKAAVLDPLFATLREARQSAGKLPLVSFEQSSSAALIETVQRYIIREEGRFYVATMIYPRAAGFAPLQIPALTRALGQGLPPEPEGRSLVLVGDPVIERDLSRIIKVNLALLVLLSFGLVGFALCLHFRSTRRALIAFVPIVFALGGACGGMAAAGIQIHFFTILLVPLMLCLAMDHVLQITQYYYDRQPISVRLVMGSLARAMVLSAGTMGLFFGTWTLTSYPGLRDFGLALLIGLLVISLSVLMLLPTMLQLFGQGQSVWSALVPEPEADQL